jgi:hypothetical protein
LDANHRTRADALRRRQREVSDALRTILAEGADSQHQVRQRATEVAQALEALRDEVRDLSQSGRAQNAAQAAVENLQNRSLPAMDRGASELAQGRLASGREAQRQAADAAEQAARHASDLAAALHADMPADAQGEPAQAQANESEGPSRGNLQSARASQAQASADLTKAVGQGNADQAKAATQSAASAMRSAAQGLRAAAAKGRGMGKQTAGAGASDPSVNPNPNGVGRAVGLHTGDLDPAQLANERRRWGELPGQLRDEMNQTDPGRYRDDYARLIRLYFREIADTEATKDTPAQPQEKQP